MELKSKKWEEFLIGDIFNINTGALLPKKILKKGNVPRITATESNNGVFDYYAEFKHKNYRTVNNFVSVSFLGSVFYHPYKASLDMKIHSVQLKKMEFNKYLAHFIVLALKRTTALFSYGDQLSSSDLPKKKILLPVDKKGEPDFKFMEAFIKQKEEEKLERYRDYITQRINSLKDFKAVKTIEEKKWSEFKISDLFDNKIGKNIDGNKVNKFKGKTAYITRKETNNGLDGFINYDGNYLNNEYPVITIGNETAEPFVQKNIFFTGTKVNILKSKNNISEFALSFITTSLRQHKSKYSYSFTINSTRLRKQKILLPVNKKDEPDYEYMENYMKQLEFKKLSEYLNRKTN
ncbi:restriction endonuclease subunit S [Tenacibaculum mesophilum]|uniref:restriction endonuclease subunit S n=1 Tax=Tenacibaculum mesophilum TaxID=104268 RepID=UPI0014322103|nr:restriction endonuclease subunit S [Tenacibaculum mesophilum]KAF9659298.1 restriction endonuclease subunit S [Tenacibaculum mesophilum]